MSDQPSKPRVIRELAENLWFPALFFFGFLLCYVLPFHAPAPHDVKVAVVGQHAAAQVEAALDKAAPGAFDIVPATSASDARDQVLGRDAVAAYAPGKTTVTLYTAKADGALLESVVNQTFTGLAEQGGQKITVTELVPTAKGDVTGTGLFYVAMVWNIVPYIAVMMLMRAVTLSRRAKVLTLAGVGAFISVVGYVVALSMDVIPNEPLAMLYGFMLSQAVAWVAYGLVPFAKQYLPGVALSIFVLLSIPSSGGAVPAQMVPGFFRALHPIMPLGNAIDAFHGIFYFDNVGLLRPTLVLCAWLVAGAALIGAGALLQHRKAAQAAADQEPGEAVEEIVEDPSIEMPVPRAVPQGVKHLSGTEPVLHGTVTEEGGEPLAGATIMITTSLGRELTRTTTDANGDYGVAGLPEDFILLLLSAPRHAPAVTRILPQEGKVLRQDFELARRAPKHARV
ncbi:carboxypeptidase regulatory-like domain-containing protein [Streptomyces sp. NPDC096311]|uniref:carboxypeptidase regulatory-like domain-containing protein n=1 Tax=Streptomyces sp. NPDC096311 TaxID=3366083 RepID=UPI0038085056